MTRGCVPSLLLVAILLSACGRYGPPLRDPSPAADSKLEAVSAGHAPQSGEVQPEGECEDPEKR